MKSIVTLMTAVFMLSSMGFASEQATNAPVKEVVTKKAKKGDKKKKVKSEKPAEEKKAEPAPSGSPSH